MCWGQYCWCGVRKLFPVHWPGEESLLMRPTTIFVIVQFWGIFMSPVPYSFPAILYLYIV
jgi:hypothetical protein